MGLNGCFARGSGRSASALERPLRASNGHWLMSDSVHAAWCNEAHGCTTAEAIYFRLLRSSFIRVENAIIRGAALR